MNEFLNFGFVAFGYGFVLLDEFVHRGCSGTRGCLVGSDMHAANRRQVVDWFERDNHLDGGAVGVGDDSAGSVERVVTVDFGNDEWNIVVHSERA